jgi:hypothetical protein
MRNIPETLRKAAAKTRTCEPPKDFDLDMLTVSADGQMFDPRQPLNTLVPQIVVKDPDGNVLASIMSFNMFTGVGIQVERDAEGRVHYDENGHPVLNHVRVGRVEIDIPPR